MIISQTPVRISFFGGGTDFYDFYSKNGGCVLSTAVNKYIYVILNRRFDRKIVLNYSKSEHHDSVNEIQHEIIREAMIKTGVTQAIDITILSDIPSEGSGMGSSSSLTVGLLNALYKYQGIDASAEKLATEACEIEITICKKPIGKQDQYIAAYGGFCEIVFQKDDSVKVNKLKLPEKVKDQLLSNLHIFYSGVTRSSNTILAEQKQNISKKNNELETLKSYTSKAKEFLLKKDFDAIGDLLNKSWLIKKTLATKISNNTLDIMYQKALEAGALGGKILGAGGGGFLLIYCNISNSENLKKSFNDYPEMFFNFENDGSKIIFNNGGTDGNK